MNSIWNKNIEYFRQRFFPLAEMYKNQIELITKADSNQIKEIFSFWQTSPAKNGSLTVTENNLRLHSSYNPEREAESITSNKDFLQKSTIVFMGFGLGYHVISAARFIKANNLQKKIILLEQDILHFFAALYFLDWSNVFETEALIIAPECPPESIISLIEDSSKINTGSGGASDTFIFSLPAFEAHQTQYAQTIKTILQRNKTKNDINAATYDKFAKLWIKNSLKNLLQIGKRNTVEEFVKGVNHGDGSLNKDCILVAAGPSLQTLLPVIKQVEKKITIVCVETALRALLRYNIQPDFIIITDPQYYAYRHIAGLKSPESVMVCPISVYPAVFRFNCKNILLCSDMFPISQYYETKLGTFGDLGAGGSVASSAWTLCKKLGAENVYCAGLDLSYPAKETHIRGSSAEQTFHIISNKLKSVEKSSINSMYSAVPEYGFNYKGEKVLTDSRMKMFAWWFESKIAANPGFKTWSLSQESLKIPGIEFYNPDTLIEKYLVSAEKNKIVIGEPSPSNTEKLKTAELEYKMQLKELINLINAAVEKCMINGPELNKQLQEIQKEVAKNPLNNIVSIASPSSKYLEAHITNPKELAIFTKIQQDLKFYLQ